MNWFLSNPTSVLSLRDHGLRMQDWHRSQGDPIYAVGSYHFAGKLHPQRDVIERAESGLESLLSNARTTRQKAELRRLIRGMHHYYPWLDDEGEVRARCGCTEGEACDKCRSSGKKFLSNPRGALKPISKTAQRVLETLISGLDTYQGRKLDNSRGTFMAVHVERIGEDLFSVAHYFVQNGDMMADPDVVFWRRAGSFYPAEYTQHSLGTHQRLITFENGKPTHFMPRQQADVATFCTTWMSNIRKQQRL